MGYTKTAVINTTWAGALRISTRVLSVVKMVILARILTPSDFGAIGIASLILVFLETISETGINVFLIQEKSMLEKYIDTAYVISIIRGIIICLMVLLISKTISGYFASPESYTLILLISAVPLIRGFINPSVVSFRKYLQFSKEFILQIAIFMVDTAVAISITYAIKNPIGIIYGLIAGSILEVALTHLFISPKPKFEFNKIKLKVVVKRGKWLTLAGIFNYLFENVDDIAVGRILTDFSLGIYQTAYKLASLPITEVSTVINRVSLPIFVKFSDDKPRLKKAYLKSLVFSIMIILPIGTVLFLLPEYIVKILLGNNWLEAVPIIRIMSFFGVIRAISVSTYPVFLSIKRQDLVTKITLVNIIFIVIGLLFLVKPFGILGAGISAIIGAIAGVPIALYYLFKILRQKNK